MSLLSSLVVLVTSAAAVFASVDIETKCCYGGPDAPCGGSCDGPRDYCGASAVQCKVCGGVLCNSSAVSVKEEAGTKGKCCYGPHSSECSGSCDGPDDYCGASSSKCTECGGFFCNLTDTAITPLNLEIKPLLLATDESGKCCYGEDCTDCDGPHDSCGSSPSQCTKCGGSFCNVTSNKNEHVTSGPMRCCYGKDASTCSGSKDHGCDGPHDYCSASAANCADCGGHVCPVATADTNSSKTEKHTTANKVVSNHESKVPVLFSEHALRSNAQVATIILCAFAGLGMVVSLVLRQSSQRSTEGSYYLMTA